MCDDRVAALVDYAEATIEPNDRIALEAHLQGCKACRHELELVRGTTAILHGTRSEPHPLSTSRFVARTADAAERHRDGTLRGLWWSLTRGVRLALATSLASLVAAACLVSVDHVRPSVPATRDPLPLAATTATTVTTPPKLDPSLAYETGFDGLSDADLEELDQLLDIPSET